MNKVLFATAFATLFSNAAFSGQTPDYSNLPVDFEQYCKTYDTQKCQEFAILINGFKARGIPHLMKEEVQQLNDLYYVLVQEKAEKEGDIVTIKDNTQKETESVINQTT